jgi:glycosyltransferase involved in cell wall biosynthesis
MRILMVTPEYSKDGRSGGAGIHVHHLCMKLAQQGHHVDVIAPLESDSKLLTPFDIYDLKIGRRPVFGLLKWSIEAYICSKKLMQTEKYDVVHVHCLASLYPCFYTSEIPMVITMHSGWALSSRQYSLHTKIFSLLRDLLSCKKSKRIIVLNRFFERELLRWGVSPRKVRYIPNGIDRKEFKKEQSNSKMFRQKFGISQEALVLLFVGRLMRGKGVENLLDAARMIQNRTKKPIFTVIAGDGSLRLDLMRRSKNLRSIFFTGYLSRDEVISAYKESDLLVVPSEVGEGMPTVLLEAMAAGLPIVSTRVPGIVEIAEGEFARLVSPGNPHELANTILDTIADIASLREMGRRAASWSTQFDWNIISKRVVEVYDSCIQTRRAEAR